MRIIRITASILIGVLLILSACTKLSTPRPTPAQGANVVRVSGREFKPSIIKVPVGTTVIWINYDGEQHSVTSNTGLFAGSLPPFASFNYTFTERGTFEYYCQNHDYNGEAGAVVIE
ncbi:MAG: cupredoxin domain-containing protein [Dehalococcoidales bacterium]|nr:cupredoxin domain-containing protein [Dehalococcoidales bacterium]